MLESLPVIILVGTVLGFLTGLGVGGGSLLIIWLTAVLGMDPATARGINLLFFLPGAFIAVSFRKKQGNMKWGSILPPAAAGCIAAAVFSYLSTMINVEIIRKLFGIILLAAGIREVLWKNKCRGGS